MRPGVLAIFIRHVQSIPALTMYLLLYAYDDLNLCMLRTMSKCIGNVSISAQTVKL